jgi:hypothetical protein
MDPIDNEALSLTDRGKRYSMLILVIAGTIKDVGEAPSGAIYSALMSLVPNIDINEYQEVIDTLVRIKVIKRGGSHLLTYQGTPAFDRALNAFDEIGRKLKNGGI